MTLWVPPWLADGSVSCPVRDSGIGDVVESAGDVNGDGFDDIVIGAQYFGTGEQWEGAVFVFHGSETGIQDLTTDQADTVITGGQANSFLGAGVASAGDVNGDGFDDLVIGAWGFSSGQTDEGVVLVFYGSLDGIRSGGPADADVIIEANQENAYLGWSVASAGDVNHDSFEDIIVGSYRYTNGHDHEGAAFVFLGSPGGIVATNVNDASAMIEANQSFAHMGASVAPAGDVNGDGFDDVIVGALKFDHGEVEEGAAFVFHGSAAGVVGGGASDANALVESNQAMAHLGMSVDGAGDVNGDGYDDVIVAAPSYANGEGHEGIALVFHGSEFGVLGGTPVDADSLFESNQGAAVINHVSTAGDVNGDGFADVLVGAYAFDHPQSDEGAVFVLHGSAVGVVGGNPDAAEIGIESDQSDAWMSRAALAGDINGDGFSDVVVGAPRFDTSVEDGGFVLLLTGSSAGLLGLFSDGFECGDTSHWTVGSSEVTSRHCSE
jgi:hypothetical protein